MADRAGAEPYVVHLDPIEHTVVTEKMFVSCPHAYCDQRWQHRGGLSRELALDLYATHERLVHGIQ